MANGLSPSEPADRLTIARRVALDLTGLPPTWEQANAFLNDKRDNAYERYVDDLLASPAFGERWARVWLDLARYADSSGYADDPPRTIWAYRDYVIRSLNDNKPFDQFTIEQIAGDLLDNPTDEQLIATAFHRNTMTNNEGGTNDEEFRNVAVVDRVNTTMAVWMGTTMACAQCHTHKYDPITHDEYYQFFAFFNNTADADLKDEKPTFGVWSDQQREEKQRLEKQIADLKAALQRSTPQIEAAQSKWLAELKAYPSWNTVRPIAATSSNRPLNVDENGWISTDSETPHEIVCRIDVPLSAPVTGVRLEQQQHDAASGKKAPVPQSVSASWRPHAASSVDARYVRIELPGKNKFLHLAEVQAFANGVNVAPQGTATQSSSKYSDNAHSAIDENTNGDFTAGSVTHTEGEDTPWLEIDFGSVQPIDSVAIWNRTDGGSTIIQRLRGFEIQLLDEQRNKVWTHQPEKVPSPNETYPADGAVSLSLNAIASPQSSPGSPKARFFAFETPRDLSNGLLTVHLSDVPAESDRFRLSVTTDDSLPRWTKLPKGIQKLVRTSSPLRANEQRKLDEYYRGITPLLDDRRAELKSLQSRLAKIQPQTTVPIMRQLPENKRRTTHVHLRGSYLSHGNQVEEGVPAAFHPLKIAPGKNRPDRMTLARWLVDEDNPLTARVIANRHWEQIFGIGLVETSEEFGSQGELPSHPKLLDYLAVELQQNGWNLKALLRLLVTSATYRQSSAATPELIETDPANRLCARGPRFRASAEMVRDQALFVSGLLSPKMYGAPVRPMQPDLGLKAAFGSATDWQTSKGEDRYRRGIYTMWRRSSPYPSMAQFDAPNREVCTVRRIRTNTPLQALVTLNDPVYIEAAQALARNVIASSDSTD
ncbi:MAG: DUF1553 domain-containing protein, partial [Rhodopirellula sp. JB053]